MRKSIALGIIAALVTTFMYSPGYAAGSGGGGISGGSGISSQRAIPPEEQSKKRLRSGIKSRDKALAFEEKAAAASKEKTRAKYLKKARKAYKRAIDQQGKALQLDPQNYKAANELGFAYRKSGEFKKAIGAYNYALELNPNFHQATEYRGEAFLALGMLKQTQQSYMLLFRNNRALADMLMQKVDVWIADKGDELSSAEADFVTWVGERKRLAGLTRDLSMNNTRTW